MLLRECEQTTLTSRKVHHSRVIALCLRYSIITVFSPDPINSVTVLVEVGCVGSRTRLRTYMKYP